MKKTMETIEIENEVENVNIQIQQLQTLITDLRIMKLTTENFELLKEHKELFIYKSSEFLNILYEKFNDMEQVLDDTAFYFQNLVKKRKNKNGCKYEKIEKERQQVRIQ